MYKEENVRKLNLQFFAGENEGGESNDSVNCESSNNNGSSDNSENSNELKTFTQEEVTKMMAKEKMQGKNSVLSKLGFKTEKEALLYFAKKEEEENKKKEEKENKDKPGSEKIDQLMAMIQQLQEANITKDRIMEEKFACVTAGVKESEVQDVLAIARTKIDDEKDISCVLAEMKKDKKYTFFFEGNDDIGTGNVAKNVALKEHFMKDDIGKRLAEQRVKARPKTKFFD